MSSAVLDALPAMAAARLAPPARATTAPDRRRPNSPRPDVTRDPIRSPPARPAAAAPAASAGPVERRAIDVTASPASLALVATPLLPLAAVLARDRVLVAAIVFAQSRILPMRSAWSPARSRSLETFLVAFANCLLAWPTDFAIDLASRSGKALPDRAGHCYSEDRLAAHAALEHDPARDSHRSRAHRCGRPRGPRRDVLDRVGDTAAAAVAARAGRRAPARGGAALRPVARCARGTRGPRRAATAPRRRGLRTSRLLGARALAARCLRRVLRGCSARCLGRAARSRLAALWRAAGHVESPRFRSRPLPDDYPIVTAKTPCGKTCTVG